MRIVEAEGRDLNGVRASSDDGETEGSYLNGRVPGRPVVDVAA